MLISPAFAQAAGAAPGGGMEIFLPFILIIVVFYFLLWRPQQKKVKQHKEMLSNLKRGDRIVTGGGIVGRIARVEGDDELIVEVAPEVRLRVVRSTVADVLSRSEPAAAAGEASGGKKQEKPAAGKKPDAGKRGGRKSAVQR